MSVILFSKREIEETMGMFNTIVPSLPYYRGQEQKEEFKGALLAFHYANVAAYTRTYNDAWTHGEKMAENIIPVGELLKSLNNAPSVFSEVPYEPRLRLYDELGSFLYNCVSNSGDDFMPVKHKQTLEHTRRLILETLAGLTQERRGENV